MIVCRLLCIVWLALGAAAAGALQPAPGVCTIHVVSPRPPTGSHASRPRMPVTNAVTSPEEALALRRSTGFRRRCATTATIELQAGATFHIASPPLRLEGRQDSDTVWTSSNPPCWSYRER